jgi:hypothetical protein
MLVVVCLMVGCGGDVDDDNLTFICDVNYADV